jgi:hypothetical protein
MKLQDALKISLDELRMQMLGVQVLFGFQFQGLFQDAFTTIPAATRYVDLFGLLTMLVALSVLVAVPCQHRLTDGGHTTRRIYAVSNRYAKVALLPLAVGIGIDIYVASRHPFGGRLSVALAGVVCVLASCAWYGLGYALKRAWMIPSHEVTMEAQETPLHVKIEQMLTEARVILPGAQALLGFQLIVMMTKVFDSIPVIARTVHLVALLSLAVSIVLLIAPAALHRVAFGSQEDPRLLRVGSAIIAAALLPLSCAIACDMWVAMSRVWEPNWVSMVISCIVFGVLVVLWYLWPLYLRRRIQD